MKPTSASDNISWDEAVWRVRSGSVGHGEEEESSVGLGGWWSEMTQSTQSTAPREDGDEGRSVPVRGLILNSGRFMPVPAFSARWTEVGSACPEFMGKAFCSLGCDSWVPERGHDLHEPRTFWAK